MDYRRATNYIIRNIRSESLMKKIYYAVKEICFDRLPNMRSYVIIPLMKQNNVPKMEHNETNELPIIREKREHDKKWFSLTDTERQEVEALIDRYLSKKFHATH